MAYEASEISTAIALQLNNTDLNKIKYNRINSMIKVDDAVTNLIDIQDNCKYLNDADKVSLSEIIYCLNRMSERIENIYK